MFFLPQHIERLLSETDPDQREQELQDELAALAPRLAQKKNEYRHFGPFWWWIKPLVRRYPSARGSWLKGGYVDRGFLSRMAHLPAPQHQEIPHQEIAWLGLQYYRAEILDDTPAAIHIVEDAGGTVFAYRLYDADASEQIDLFSEPEEKAELQAFLADPGRFSGSAWLQKADTHIAQGDLLRGSAALRRALDRAVDEQDRTTAWIRLGQLFQEHTHTAKAIFCYHNAWERDREGWIQGLIAEAYLESDQPCEALPCFEAALKAMPGNPEYQAGVERCRRITRERERAFDFSAEPLAN